MLRYCINICCVCFLVDAALGLVKSSSDLFKFNSNNSLLKFLFDVSYNSPPHPVLVHIYGYGIREAFAIIHTEVEWLQFKSGVYCTPAIGR